MNALRGSTLSPIRSVKIRSALDSVLDRDPLQRATRGIHRRLAQLVGVHLAEALEALERDALARELEDRAAQLVE